MNKEIEVGLQEPLLWEDAVSIIDNALRRVDALDEDKHKRRGVVMHSDFTRTEIEAAWARVRRG